MPRCGVGAVVYGGSVEVGYRWIPGPSASSRLMRCDRDVFFWAGGCATGRSVHVGGDGGGGAVWVAEFGQAELSAGQGYRGAATARVC